MDTTKKPTPPANAQHPSDKQDVSRLGRLKIAFLYTLVAGLGLAAVTSVVALLVGEFTAIIGKTLLTIFILFSHSLLLLAILWADTKNEIGKAIISTTIFTVIFASLVTSTLGAWNILSGETVWQWMGLYFLAIGGAFIVAALLRLRVAEHTTQIAVNTATGFIIVTLITLIPWVLAITPLLEPLYFRIVAALSILSSVSFLIALILKSIATSKDPSLKQSTPRHELSNGMLAIYIVVGIITSITWNVGLFSLLDDGSAVTNSEVQYN